MSFSLHASTAAVAVFFNLFIGEVLQAGPASGPGGSTLSTFNTFTCHDDPCTYGYGDISSFDLPGNSATIGDQLQQMYDQGQRRLRIAIPHNDDSGLLGFGPLGSSTCSESSQRHVVMKSYGGNLAPQCIQNLKSLLDLIITHHFSEVIIVFWPLYESSANGLPGYLPEWPANWWSQQIHPYFDLYVGNWILITNVRQALASYYQPTLNIKYDLMAEGIPASSQTGGLLVYAQAIWNNYTSLYGKLDTVGFSMIPDQSHISMVTTVYQGNEPYIMSLDIYSGAYEVNTGTNTPCGPAGSGCGTPVTTAGEYINAWNWLSAAGHTQAWLIEECYYNDSETASEFSAAQAQVGNGVFYILQWPLIRGQAQNFNAAPIGYSNYASAGW